ncbi:phiRv1 phage protein [Mycobacterium tuberculosis]|nr:phiRv1 phage protein [Mycobacterium tuberculosis]
MTNEQHFADDGDIKQLSLDETRSAAKQLLDSVEGDLTGDVAQRFQALTRHAEELRAEQRRRGREAEEALRRCRAGELRVGAFEIADTPDGDEALANVKAGVVDSFSVGFRPIRDRREGDVLVRVEAALLEVSLTGVPAYSGAQIAGVRAESLTVVSRSTAEAWLSLLDW